VVVRDTVLVFLRQQQPPPLELPILVVVAAAVMGLDPVMQKLAVLVVLSLGG
jgi:hypothetical protein